MLLLALAGCLTADPAQANTLHVFAASSLVDAVGELAAAFEAHHPGVTVQASFAGSQTLRLQIAEGAAADVFLSASGEHVDALLASGHLTQRAVFAHNSLALVVPADNPAGLTDFSQLPGAARVVVGAEAVPIGQYTVALLDNAAATYGAGFAGAVRQRVVSEERSVRLARARVLLGEADAAIVYQTDTAHEGLAVVPIPPALNVRAAYHLGIVDADDPLARQWAGFLAGAAGCAVLSAHGFSVDACAD